ncbi:MAG: hypothetical protein GX020_03610 [Firmicutes bacterium]|nr:hypothetical protein [Bacillota bacterium]
MGQRQLAKAGKPWSEEEKDLLWNYIQVAKRNGIAMSHAFRLAAKKLGRTEVSTGVYHYNFLRKERDENEFNCNNEQELLEDLQNFIGSQEKKTSEKQVVTKQAPKKEQHIELNPYLEALKELPEHLSKLQRELDEIRQQKANPSVESIIKAFDVLVTSYNDKQTLEEEHRLLRERLEKVTEEKKSLEERIYQLNQHYEEALGLYNTFINLASISQIMGLGDFKQKMKTTLDKWGNVVKIDYEKAE